MNASLRAIDLFAGAGGFSTGAAMAGAKVVWAGNHWRIAVDVHHANHPDTQHACQDLQQADWSQVPAHDLMLAAPACQPHSSASQPGRKNEREGKAEKVKASHDAMRSTAWAPISCLEVHRPDVFVVENVRQFRDWVLYPAWRMALQALGYSVSENLIDAADVGVPQNRQRLFIVGTRSLAPLQLRLPKRDPVSARSFIDVDGGEGWEPVDAPWRGPGVAGRVARGRAEFGDKPFLTHHVTGHPGRSLDRPIGTLTTKDCQWALVRGNEMRFLSEDEHRAAMTFPKGYQIPAGTPRGVVVKLYGNAVCPLLAREIVSFLQRAA